MINKKIDKLFTEWVAVNKERILEKWIELAKIPSIKSDPAEGAPFGENCRKALDTAASYFNSENITSSVYGEDGYALAHFGKGNKTIGLFSHSDVVPVGDDWLYTKPFEPIIKDGALIGRGVEDNKSGIIASLCVMEFLRDSEIPFSSHLQLFIGSDEECGMGDMDGFLKNHPMPEISIVPDADFPCSVGEKGIYHFMTKSKNEFSDIVEICGGEAYNIVLDNVTSKIKFSEALCSELNLNDKVAVTSDENFIYVLAKGIAKHASIPEGSVNAAFLLFSVLSECESLNSNDREILKNAAELIADYYGKGIGVTNDDPTFGKMTCVNGMIRTDDNKLCVSFDVRYGSSLDPQYLESTSESTVNALGFEIIYKDNRAGFEIPKENKMPQIFEDIFCEVTGEKKQRVLMSGGTYARRLDNAFSIGTFYISPERKDMVLQMPDGHGGAHQCDEMIDIDGFFEGTRILLHYILACDENL